MSKKEIKIVIAEFGEHLSVSVECESSFIDKDPDDMDEVEKAIVVMAGLAMKTLKEAAGEEDIDNVVPVKKELN